MQSPSPYTRISGVTLRLLAFAAIALGFRAKEWGQVIANDQDLITYIRIVQQAADQLKAGHLWPRLSSFDFGGSGYPLWQFYPPLSFFFPAAVSNLGITESIKGAIDLSITIMFVVAGESVFRTCRRLGATGAAAFLGAVAFTAAPYFVFLSLKQIPTLYNLALLPLAALMLAHFAEKGRLRDLIFLQVVVVLMLLTHFLSAVLCLAGLGGLGLLMLIRLAPAERRWARLGLVAATGILALGIVAWQVGPIIQYGQHGWLRISALLSGHDAFVEWARKFTTLPNLLSPRLSESNYLEAPFVGEWGIQIGLAFSALIGLAAFQLTLRKQARPFWLGVLALACAGIALATPTAVKLLPDALGVFQFPSRFLAVFVLPAALLVAYALTPAERGLLAIGERETPDYPSGLRDAVFTGLAVAVLSASSMSTQYALLQPGTATGFTNPVLIDQITKQPSSNYSGDYLIDGFRFVKNFPGRLYGRMQYLIYWHGGLAEQDAPYPIPHAVAIPENSVLRVSGLLLDGVEPPVRLTVKLGNFKLPSLTIVKREWVDAITIPAGVPAFDTISYNTDKTTEFAGKTAGLRFTGIFFDGLPPKRTSVLLREPDLQKTNLGDTATFRFVAENADYLYVLPIFAYPDLQTVQVNGKAQTCELAPQNDLVYCGVHVQKPGPATVTVAFSGSPLMNTISLAALAASCALYLMLALLLLRRRAPAKVSD